MKKSILISSFFTLLMLCACSQEGAEPTATVPETAAAENTQSGISTETIEHITETSTSVCETVSEETVTAKNETETEIVPQKVDHDRSFVIYYPTVYEYRPFYFKIDEIMSKRRDDMYKYAEPYLADYEYDSETQTAKPIYKNAVEYAEEYYGYSFDSDSCTKAVVFEDFDNDGKNENYLCLTEYLYKPDMTRDMVHAEDRYGEYVDCYFLNVAALISVYYIDDNKESRFAFGRLVGNVSCDGGPIETEKYLYENEDISFKINYGNIWYLSPLICKYENRTHLFWPQGGAFEMDYGAEIFEEDKHIRTEISMPSERDGSFFNLWSLYYEASNKEKELYIPFDIYNGNNMNKDILDYTDCIDCIQDKLVFNGENYEYIISPEMENDSNYSIKNGVIEWDDHSEPKWNG